MLHRLSPCVFLALALGAGCNPVEGLVERGIEGKLPEVIGPADRYAVDVEGLRTNAGEAERVTVLGERVRPEGAPVLDRLDLELRGVHYDENARRLERVESAHATARILPPDLTAFLDAQRHVRASSITLQPPDGATLRFRPEIGGLVVPEGVAVEMAGRLVPDGGHVRFEVSEVRAGGLNLGRTVARRLSEAINPIVDLSETPAGLRVTGIRVEAGAVVIETTGDPAGLGLRRP